ncbi:MAG: TetR/AcrR family transcriptional regulator [Clostridia bacterium]|nr:TetR/AcrR family transcriptional regulator [Clostridia bacterium]MBN2883123.1 TetR/AcrR family transcriptional regulator [Clostridia bacterium]
MSDKKEKILKAVLELFLENGAGSLKVSKIATKADVGKGTVYEYFNSKEDLFIGAVEYGLDLMTDMISEKVTITATFKDSFFSLVDCIFDIVLKGPFISLAANPGSMPFTGETISRLKPIIENAHKSFLKLLGTIINKGVEEGILAPPKSDEYLHLILVMVTNMTMQQTRKGSRDMESLKQFYYDACVKLLS